MLKHITALTTKGSPCDHVWSPETHMITQQSGRLLHEHHIKKHIMRWLVLAVWGPSSVDSQNVNSK